MLKAIFFDLDDTLLWDAKSISEAFGATCRYAATQVKVDADELESSVRASARELYASYDTYEFTQMIGINPFEGLWGDFFDEHDENFTKLSRIAPGYREEAWKNGLEREGVRVEGLGEELAERFREERKKHPFVYDETFDVLEKVKDSYELILLTNGSPHLQHTKLELTPELVPYFKEIIVSGAVGKGKPEPEMFEIALEKVGIAKEEAIMVGDNLNTDIKGANQCGIRTVWINHHQKKPELVTPTYEIDRLAGLIPLLDLL